MAEPKSKLEKNSSGLSRTHFVGFQRTNTFDGDPVAPEDFAIETMRKVSVKSQQKTSNHATRNKNQEGLSSSGPHNSQLTSGKAPNQNGK